MNVRNHSRIRLEVRHEDKPSSEVVRQTALPKTRTSVVLAAGGPAPLPEPFRPAPRPENEVARQRAVDVAGLDGTAHEHEFDEVVALASRICGTPIALFTVLSNERQWVKSVVGLDVQETTRDEAFCGYAILGKDTLVVEDATKDPRFAGNPLVTGETELRFYAGVPVAAPSGEHVGTLCVLAQHARTLSADQQLALEVLARQIETQLSLRHALRTQLALAKEKQELTDLIIHDLKSPLASIAPNASFIKDSAVDEDTRLAASDIIEAAQRLQRMVLDVLDTSIANQSGLQPRLATVDVRALLRDVQAGTSARTKLEVELDDTVLAVVGDVDLLRRVLDNLVDNAVKYGGNTLVRITARAIDGAVELAVRDLGRGIAAIDRDRVFARGQRLAGTSAESARNSRGLGLRFCALAVEAHGGRIWVEDNAPRGSAFCFTIPTTSQR